MYSQINQDWTKLFGGSRSDICYSVTEATNGDIVVAGRVYSKSMQCYNYIIMELNKEGLELWRKTSNSSVNDEYEQ